MATTYTATNFNLKQLMDANHVTIRTLGAYMNVTHKRIRSIRNGLIVSPLIQRDYREAVTNLAALANAA